MNRNEKCYQLMCSKSFWLEKEVQKEKKKSSVDVNLK